MTRHAIQLLLSFSGLILVALGLAILVAPHAFFATNGIALGADPSLLSEIRAPGALLVVCGLVVLRGVLHRKQARTSLFAAVLVYGAFGAARLLSMVLDGAPATSLLWATGIELGLAILCASAMEHKVVLDDEQITSVHSQAMDRGIPTAT
ncbi:MAG: DUF4345 domain-containing protein [Bacteroidota bacterium]